MLYLNLSRKRELGLRGDRIMIELRVRVELELSLS